MNSGIGPGSDPNRSSFDSLIQPDGSQYRFAILASLVVVVVLALAIGYVTFT